MNSKTFTSSLRAVLRSRGIKYEQVAQQLDVSESTVKRWFSSGGMSLDQYAKVLEMADVRFEDLARIIDSKAESEVYFYSEHQEQVLVKHPKAHAFFNLLLKYEKVSVVERKCKLPKSVVSRSMKLLDNIGLIEWKEKNRFKFLVSKKVAWRKNGPLRKQFLSEAKNEFLNSNFSGELSSFRFLNLQLSQKASSQLMGKISKVLDDGVNISEVEKSVNNELEEFGFLFAFRPWSFSKLKF